MNNIIIQWDKNKAKITANKKEMFFIIEKNKETGFRQVTESGDFSEDNILVKDCIELIREHLYQGDL